jgi:gluconokinase
VAETVISGADYEIEIGEHKAHIWAKMVIVIWGVSGAGKTTIGKLLSRELGWKFLDADDFHSLASMKKMRSGVPLTDEDRQPWLEKLRAAIEQSLAANENAVLACSALKKKYRDRLRVSHAVKFVFLRGDRQQIETQLRNRRGHFVNPDLLDTQFADLEEPKSCEGVVIVDLGPHAEELVEAIEEKLQLRGQKDWC